MEGDDAMNDQNMLELELNALLDASNDNIVIADGQGTIIRASANCQAIYGVEAAALIGETADDLQRRHIFSPSVTKKVLEEKSEAHVMQQTKTGKTVMATGIPVFDEAGEIVRVISFSHDLTEIERLRERYELLEARMEQYESEIEQLRHKDMTPEDIAVKSKPMQNVWNLVKRVAKSDATVVFLGESGVGKTVLARALHERSKRKQGDFIEVNCSTIPETLFEAEMFGYEKGSFTGASKEGKPGLIELAEGGTLFLDEVAELPLAVQSKLLKVVQEKRVTRVGGTKSKRIDFRLIAATNQNLEERVRRGDFREDLYFRLHVIPITVPPLRERPEDILMLTRHYMERFNRKYQTQKTLHPSATGALLRYHWPGNVRELENMMERLVLTAEHAVITREQLPFQTRNQFSKDPEGALEEPPQEKAYASMEEELAAVEKKWFVQAYKKYKTTYKIAEHLGISQPTVVRRLKKYNIS